MIKCRLKVRLAELDMKQRELAIELGVTNQTISLWSNNKSTPPLELAFKISKLLGCKIDELFCLCDD